MCRCAGVPARMTDKTRDVGTRCAGVPPRMTKEAHDPGSQLFCTSAPPAPFRVTLQAPQFR